MIKQIYWEPFEVLSEEDFDNCDFRETSKKRNEIVQAVMETEDIAEVHFVRWI